MLFMRFALVASTLALLTVDVSAKCAMVAITPAPLTAKNASVGTGGVVVGLSYNGREGGRAQSIEKTGWKFKQGAKEVEPTVRVIAPSLAVFEFTGDSATLVDTKSKPLLTVKHGKDGKELTAPVIKAAIGGTSGSDMERWGTSSHLTVELSSDAPAGAIGVIIYQGGKAQNWSVFEAKSKLFRFNAGGHCSNDLPDTLVPTTGEITVAYFDGSGRVSPPSKAIKIALAPRD
jgi:hypothetical protein